MGRDGRPGFGGSMRVAFLFPGQGSQRPGMGADLAGTPGQAVLKRAEAVLGLNPTEVTSTRPSLLQPALFAVSLGYLEVLRSLGVDAVMVSGHSLGEYTALVAAGALSPEEGLEAVRARGEGCERAAELNPGGMTALLGPTAPLAAEAAAGQGVWVANTNSPEEVVLAGREEALARAEASLPREVRKVRLKVGAAYHTPLMEPALPVLEKALTRIRFSTARLPVVSSATAETYEGGRVRPEDLLRQLVSPVRWWEALQKLLKMGASALVEVGPGGVLARMAKRFLTGVHVFTAGSLEECLGLARTLRELEGKGPEGTPAGEAAQPGEESA